LVDKRKVDALDLEKEMRSLLWETWNRKEIWISRKHWGDRRFAIVEKIRGEEQREPKLPSQAKSLAVAPDVKDWNLILVILHISNSHIHQNQHCRKRFI
jgi:hypothetical protein